MTDGTDRPVVLLADDEQAITDQLAPLLERAGFSVRVVHNGTDALQATETDEPDLVVLDVMMPEPDGREVLRRLRARLLPEATRHPLLAQRTEVLRLLDEARRAYLAQ